jgi:hypothetical protein
VTRDPLDELVALNQPEPEDGPLVEAIKRRMRAALGEHIARQKRSSLIDLSTGKEYPLEGGAPTEGGDE